MANENENTTAEVYENEATVLQFSEASNISLADILYLIQGTGADRDRKMTLEQLRDFLQVLFTKIKVIGVGGNAQLTNALLMLKNGTRETNVDTDGFEVNSGTEKAFFKVGSFGFESDEGANGQVDYDASNHNWVFNIACQFDEGVTIYGDCNVIGKSTIDYASVKRLGLADTIFSKTTAFDPCALAEGNFTIGDVIVVENTATVSIRVYIDNIYGSSTRSYVNVNAGCSMMFICTVPRNTRTDPNVMYKWCPIGNVSINSDNVGG